MKGIEKARQELNAYQKAVKVKMLPFGGVTEEGGYYAEVNGEPVGEMGRAFWPTEEEAELCGYRYWMKETNL